jgi:hypothetical protein
MRGATIRYQNPYYAEKYMQQHRQELLREAEQMRLAASARAEGKATRPAMNPFSEMLMALSFRLRPGKQLQPKPKSVTSNL